MKALFIVILCVTSLQAYQPKELLFSTKNFFEYERRSSGRESSVMVVKGAKQFSSYVLKSSLPVVVKVFAPRKEMVSFSHEKYQDVADTHKGAASFVSMNFVENEDVINF
jgi:hypothetical protein